MSERPLRIGLLTPGWPGTNTPNGISTWIHHLATGLDGIGCEVVILAMSREDRPGPFSASVVPVINAFTFADRLRFRILGRESTKWRAMVRAISAAIYQANERFGLDIVIMEETHGWSAGVARNSPVPVVPSLRGPWALISAARGRQSAEDRRRISREKLAMASAPGLLAPTRSAMSVSDGVAPPDVPRAVIPNPFPVDRLDPCLGAESETGAGRILYVGRFERLKGADILLDAFTRIATRHADARLTFVGPDRGLSETAEGSGKSVAETLADLPENARARVDYLGELPKEQVQLLRKSHRIAVIASRYETLGNVALEAMAAGQAIVSTSAGGLAEVLEDGVTAKLVPPEDPAALAQGLDQVLDDQSLAARLGAAARARVETHHSPALIAERTRGFLERVLERQNAPSSRHTEAL